MKPVSVAAWASAMILLGQGCTGGHQSTPAAPTSTLSAVGPTTAPLPTLSARLVLSGNTIRAGHSISGTIVVTNATSTPIQASTCDLTFQVLLVNSSYHPNPIWATQACARDTIPVGETSYKTTIEATYNSCNAQGGPVCEEGGYLPALPQGSYEATTFAVGTAVRLPRPVPITVTK